MGSWLATGHWRRVYVACTTRVQYTIRGYILDKFVARGGGCVAYGPPHRIRIETALACGECIDILYLKRCIRIGFVALIAQISKRLPKKRIQFQCTFICLDGQFLAFSFRTQFAKQLQCKACDLTKLICYLVQMGDFGECVIG